MSLQQDGTVLTWGWNALGQLGNGTTSDSNVPAAVPGLGEIRALAFGAYYHVAALKADGTVWTWGWNLTGQLRDGTSNSVRTVPRQVPGVSDVTSLTGGGLHTVAARSTGVVQAWGWNAYGQLGDGTTTDRPVPIRIWLAPGASVSGGLAHTAVSATG